MNEADAITESTWQALAWRFASTGCQFFLHLSVVIILARLLSAEAFGLAGQALLLWGLATVFSESSFASAIVQWPKLERRCLRVALGLSVVLGLMLALLIFGLAPATAAFFNSQELVPLIRVLALTLPVSTFAATAAALLHRELNQRAVFQIDLGAYLIYAVIGISLAIQGWGAGALVGAVVGQSLFKAILVVPYLPRPWWPILDPAAAISLTRYALGMTSSRLLLHSARNIDYLIVGRLLGSEALGYYTRAFHLVTLPITRFSGVINVVLFSAYSRIQNDLPRLRRAYLEHVALAAMVVFPVLAALLVLAPEIIDGLFGSGWTAAILPLRFLCVGGAFLTLSNLSETIARAKGLIQARMWRHLAFAVTVSLTAGLGAAYGLAGVSVGVVLALAFQYALMTQMSLKLTRTAGWDYLFAHVPGTVLAVATGLTALACAAPLRQHRLPDLAIAAIALGVCTVVTLLMSITLFRPWLPPSVLRFLAGFRGLAVFGSATVRSRFP